MWVEEGLGSIRKRLPRPDITFNLLMHRHKGVGALRLSASKEEESILSAHLDASPSWAVSTAFEK